MKTKSKTRNKSRTVPRGTGRQMIVARTPALQRPSREGSAAANGSSRPTNERRQSGETRSTRKERVRLELIRFEVDRKDNLGNRLLGKAKVEWDVYFIFCLEHPDDPAKTVVWTYPERAIDMTRKTENVIALGNHGSGATVLECAMPDDRRMTLRCYLMQSKSKTRKTGEVMGRISNFVKEDVAPLAGKLATQSGAPQAVIAVEAGKVVNAGIGVVGSMLADTADKQRGFASLEQAFQAGSRRQVHPLRADFTEAHLLVRWSTEFV